MRIILYTLILFSVFASDSFAASIIYPGEKLIRVNQIETLTKFIKGDPKKPLIIFIPGDSHLARVAYGYPGGNPSDFLSYWVNKKGYSFLGLSYPLDNPVFTQTYPSFTIQNWGEQIAETAKHIIQENKLSNRIIVVGWSMGGSIEETVNVAAKLRHLKLDLFIGLSAVPPLPYVMQLGVFDTNKMLPNKLADRKMFFDIYVKLIKEQNAYNQHEIIPKELYLSQFLGNIPAAISAEGYYYQNGKFIRDFEKTLKDGGVYNFAQTPWIALIRDDAALTAKLSFIDPASWNFLRTEMIYKNYLANINRDSLPKQDWEKIMSIINTMPNDLTLTIHGNHFFFIGEKGAKQTADGIELLIARVDRIKTQIVRSTHALRR